MRHPAAQLWDLDGSITPGNFLPFIIGQTMGEAITEAGIEYQPHLFKHVFEANKGGGITKYYNIYLAAIAPAKAQKILEKTSVADMNERVVEKYINTLNAITNDNKSELFNIRSGVHDVMRYAQEHGAKIALVTNADARLARANMLAAGLYVRGEEFTGAHNSPIAVDSFWNRSHCPTDQDRKPSGYLYQMACKDLQVDPKFTIGFEDSENGHQALRNADVNTRVCMLEDETSFVPVFKHIHNDKEKIIPAHVAVGPEDLSVSFYNERILPVFNARLTDKFRHSAELRTALNIPGSDPALWEHDGKTYRPRKDVQMPRQSSDHLRIA